ncbi:MAG: hypothetical protein H6656_13245 [Ardenticatenaceae bacterium]|nr:hypothetical protein [Ardenticatenaceae bacterium]
MLPTTGWHCSNWLYSTILRGGVMSRANQFATILHHRQNGLIPPPGALWLRRKAAPSMRPFSTSLASK